MCIEDNLIGFNISLYIHMICTCVYAHKSYTPPDTIGALAGWLCIVSGIFHPSVDAQTGAVALGTGQQSL